MYLSVAFGASPLTNVGYAFYTSLNSVIGARTTSGVIDQSNGFFAINVAVPANAACIQWDGIFTFDDNSTARLLSRADVNTPADAALASIAATLAAIPQVGSTQVYTNIDTSEIARVQISADV